MLPVSFRVDNQANVEVASVKTKLLIIWNKLPRRF